jgi:hypothetical protein
LDGTDRFGPARLRRFFDRKSNLGQRSGGKSAVTNEGSEAIGECHQRSPDFIRDLYLEENMEVTITRV